MTKQVFLALGCLALLALFTAAAMADDITFTFTHDPGGNALSVSATQLIFAQPDDVRVKNSSGTSFALGANARAGFSSSNGTYTPNPLSVTATYLGGARGVVQVEVTGGVGGICGVCLQGETNIGTYTGFAGDVGDFSGNFLLTFLDPAIFALFGDNGQKPKPIGTDSLTSSENVIGLTSTSALFQSGQISIETTTVTPEPASLALLGTAILGVAARIRRKR